MVKWLSAWRGWLLASGILIAVGGILHPRGGSMGEMLADPAWVTGHLLLSAGVAALLIGILLHARSLSLPVSARRWATLAAGASGFELVELAFHTAAVVDLANLQAGRATPVLTTHLTLTMVAYPLWGIGLAGWIFSTARVRALGTRWLAPLGMVGILSFGFAPLVTTLSANPALGILFPLILLFALWLLVTALWPVRVEGMLRDAARSGSNRLLYQTMYGVGFTPWEGHALARPLEEIAAEPEKGRALDLGCGTGEASVFLAGAGWEVTGIDFVESALRRARSRAAAEGVTVRFVQGDVTRLSELGIGDGFRLIVDNGCLHGLSDVDLEATARGLERVSAPDARIVVSAFGRKKRRGPRGLDRSDLQRSFGGDWELSGGDPDPRVSNDAGDPIHVYELRRRARVGSEPGTREGAGSVTGPG